MFGDKGLKLRLYFKNILEKVKESEKDFTDDIITCTSKQIGYSNVPDYSSILGRAEILTLLSNDETDYCLNINKDRDGFDIGDDDVSVDGLECNDIKYLKAHPNMTDNWNHFMVVMD